MHYKTFTSNRRIKVGTKMMGGTIVARYRNGARRTRRGGRIVQTNVRRGLRRFIPGLSRTGGLPSTRFQSRISERKYFDTSVKLEKVGAGGPEYITLVMESLNLIPRGVAGNERIGQKAKIVAIDYDLEVENRETDASQEIFTALVLDTQCNGDAADPADVYDNITANNNGFRKIENTHRFRVLKRWTHVHSPFPSVISTKHWRGSLKVNIPINWDNTNPASAIGNVRSNNLFLICGVSELGTVQDGSGFISFKSRLRYYD